MKPALNPVALVNLKEDAVTRMLSRLGLSYRISKRDGVMAPAAKNANLDRYNLVIENNVVSEVRLG